MDPPGETLSSPSKAFGASDKDSEFLRDAECSPKPQSPEQQPKEPTSATAECDCSEIQKTSYGNVRIMITEKSGLEISSTDESKVGNIQKEDTQFEEKSIGRTKSPQKEAIDPSKEMKVSTDEDPPSGLMLEYINKYASEYSEDLLFAVDIMTLVRYLNELDMRYILYGTRGNAPTSSDKDTLEQAFRVMWKHMKNNHGSEFESKMKETKKMNSHRFQEMMLHIARREEESGWRNEKSFLTYCLLLAECAVYAEQNGVKDAPDFIPLIICRTIRNLRDSGQFPVNFWENIAKLALDITKEFK